MMPELIVLAAGEDGQQIEILNFWHLGSSAGLSHNL